MSIKQRIGTLSACISTFSSLLFILVLWYFKKDIEFSKIIWDLETVTASDYTLEIPLSQEQVAALE